MTPEMRLYSIRRYIDRMQQSTLPQKVNLSEHRLLLALAIARQGRSAEALKLAEPELRFHRDLLKGGSEDLTQHLQLARALLVVALASPPQRKELLAEAGKVMDGLPAEMAKRKPVAQLRGWIAQEAAKRS
jgi:hypothetical protein